MNVKDFLYYELFTTSTEAMSLMSQRIGTVVDFDAFGGREVFTAIVLTKPVVFVHADIASVHEGYSGAARDGSISKFAFKARIIDDPSPHYFLPDPCDISISKNPKKQLRRTFLHTTFISTDDYADSEGGMPSVGDHVFVRLTKNVFSYNLQFGEFMSITALASEEKRETLQACANIDDSFLSDYEIPTSAKYYKNSGREYVPGKHGAAQQKGAYQGLSEAQKSAICDKLKDIKAKEPTQKIYGNPKVPQWSQFSKEYNLWRYSQPTAANMKWFAEEKGVTTFLRMSGTGVSDEKDEKGRTSGCYKNEKGQLDCTADLHWDPDLEMPFGLDGEVEVAKCLGGVAYHVSAHDGYKCYEGYTLSVKKAIEVGKKKNVLFHCSAGADRTGLMVAAWLQSDTHAATKEGMPPRPAGAKHSWGNEVTKDNLLKYACSYNGWWTSATRGRVSNPTKDNIGFAKYVDGFYPIKELCKSSISKGWPLCGDGENSWNKFRLRRKALSKCCPWETPTASGGKCI